MALRLSLYLNSALAGLKAGTQKSLRLCIVQATHALEIHSDPVEEGTVHPMSRNMTADERAKAYFRRGAAQNLLKEYDAAIADFQAALALVPSDKAVEAELKKAIAKRDELKKKQQKAYSKMFA